jgi:3-oxoacyl-[acyl-carrier-protein] synthase II
VLFVIESAAHARARGAHVYGTVAGGALTTDAFHISHPDPTGRQPRRAMRLALARTETEPADVDYIVAHGTATRINDAVETSVIRSVFGTAADDVLVSSPKSMVGHLIGAAGALSAMVALLAMRDGVVPPTINLETPDPACDLDYVPLIAREAQVRTAAVNAFGFGGQNCVVVLKAAEE